MRANVCRALAVILVGTIPLASTAVTSGEARADGPPKRIPVAIIVHEKNPARNLKLEELRHIFLLEEQFWSDNEKAVVFLRPSGTAEKDALLEKVFNMTAEELKKYWTTAVFSGKASSVPTAVRSSAAAIASVRQTRGGIAAVVSADVSLASGVRVLSIDGKQPGDADYPLVVERR
jgi:hypothetical protein